MPETREIFESTKNGGRAINNNKKKSEYELLVTDFVVISLTAGTTRKLLRISLTGCEESSSKDYLLLFFKDPNKKPPSLCSKTLFKDLIPSRLKFIDNRSME